ncbi:hypothetical protein CEXT_369151 [Caerostris extrusa]|uniref:Uncharacterized protein n=1 Tax=Caerostris extrusa TaxID=172846 RepID=A0AAV4XIU7_CAEEX|nr:hypothetical protein CEXT_369151 [Caerostris extrusa]
MWNFPKYLFPCLLCGNVVIQILWLTFISNSKDYWAVLVVQFLQLWICICVFRSRARLRLLTKELYRISKCCIFTQTEKENVEDLHLAVLFISDLHDCTLRSDVCQFWDDSSRTAATA